LRKEKSVDVQKIEVDSSLTSTDSSRKEKMEVLLDNSTTELLMSLEFVRKNKFKKKKLERSIYIRNVDNIFNHEELIEYIVEVKLFYKWHKKRMEINVISGQK